MKQVLLRWLCRFYPEADYSETAGKPWLCFRRVHIGRSDGDVYLQRFILLRCPLGALYLHRFFRGDEDKCLHDHPWHFVSLILKGGYWEETEGVILDEHRTGNVWTLILTTRKVRSWGFWTNNGTTWVGWREFIAGGMRGCD